MVQLVLLWGGGGIPWCQMNKRNAQGLAKGLAVLILIGVSEKKNPYFDSILRTKLFIQKKFLIRYTTFILKLEMSHGEKVNIWYC